MARALEMRMIAYVDDTGTHSEATECTLVACIARSEMWETFERAWADECAKPPITDDFHMQLDVRIANSRWSLPGEQGASPDMLRTRRDARLSALRAIIAHHVSMVFRVSLNRALYHAIVEGKVPTRTDDPYLICFWHMRLMVAQFHASIGAVEPIQFVFDNQGRLGTKAAKLHEEMIVGLPADAALILAPRPTFAHDKTCIPIKAADMIAWYFQRKYRAIDAGTAFEFERELDQLAKIPGRSDDISADRLVVIADALRGNDASTLPNHRNNHSGADTPNAA